MTSSSGLTETKWMNKSFGTLLLYCPLLNIIPWSQNLSKRYDKTGKRNSPLRMFRLYCPKHIAVSHLMMDMALHSFDYLWKKAQEALLKSPVGLLREMHESHAMAYTMNSSLHSQLNWATSIAGSSPEHYRHKFSFKYFHLNLTTAIQIMKQWGVKDLYIEARVGSRVHFTSTSHLWNEAQKSGKETSFTVTTCLGAAAQGFSYYTSEKEVLIPLKYHCQLMEGIVHILSCKGVQDSLVSSTPSRPHQLHLHGATLKAKSVACLLCSPTRAT
uniref:NAD(P)(+)--arginine ADP-ribosyltransferase n=1 Tax=Falco tinnunculus TaxID=100819 RepID=A0A8C4XP87_FALTI